MGGPDESDAIVQGLTGGGTPDNTEAGAGVFSPEQLQQAGVPPALIDIYRSAINEWNTVASTKPSPFDSTANARLTQAQARRRWAEGKVLDYLAPQTKTVQPKGTHSNPVYDPRTARSGYMLPWGEPAGGSPGKIIGLENPTTGDVYTLPKAEDTGKIYQIGRSILKENPATGQFDVMYTQPAEPKEYAPHYPSILQRGNKAWWVDPTTQSITQAMDFGPEEPSPWEREKEANDNQYRQAQLDNQREASRRSAETSVFGQLSNLWQNSVPYALLPGQKYFLGGGPNDLYSRIASMSGRSYDPNTMQVQPMQADPLAMYREAQSLINQKG